MKKLPYLGIMVVAALLAFICGANINGDNGEALLWVGAIGFGAAALIFLYLAARTPKV